MLNSARTDRPTMSATTLATAPNAAALSGKQESQVRAILADIINGETSVLFVGSGFSYDATNGTDWRELMKPLGERLGARIPPNWSTLSPQAQAQVFQDSFNPTSARCLLEEAVINSTRVRPGFPRQLEQSIIDLPVKMIITTNYDDLVERTLKALGKTFRVIVDEAELIKARPLNGEVLVIKMHGDHSSRNMVVTQRDYDAYALERPRMHSLVQTALLTGKPIFYGFSMRDPNVRQILQFINTAPSPLANPEGPHEARRGRRGKAEGYLLAASPEDGVREFARAAGLTIIDGTSLPKTIKMMETIALRSRELCDDRNCVTRQAQRRLALGGADLLGALKPYVDAVSQSAENELARWGHRGDKRQTTSSRRIATIINEFSNHRLLEEQGISFPAERWLRFGRALMSCNHYDEAKVALELAWSKLVRSNGDESQLKHTKVLLGRVNTRLGEYRAALRLFSEFLPFHHEQTIESVLDVSRFSHAVLGVARQMLGGARRGAAGIFVLEQFQHLLPDGLESVLTYKARDKEEIREIKRACQRLRDCLRILADSRHGDDSEFKQQCLLLAEAFNVRKDRVPKVPRARTMRHEQFPRLPFDVPAEESVVRISIAILAGKYGARPGKT